LKRGGIWITRASANIRYPCQFLFIAAANPCKCRYLYQAERACNKAPIAMHIIFNAYPRRFWITSIFACM